jgi:hypothetical protein
MQTINQSGTDGLSAGRLFSAGMVLMVVLLAGCSSTPSPFKGAWTANPDFAEVDHALCTARITPLKGDNTYYAFFLLSLVNKTEGELLVDWNASRYLAGGKPQGMLVFQGIDPEAVKNGTLPLEPIAPGGRLERNLMPMRLIAWSPVREKTSATRAITPGMLPAGENGVLLALRQAGRPITIPLSVRLDLEQQH